MSEVPEIGVGSVLDGAEVIDPENGDGSVLAGAGVAPHLDLAPAERSVPDPEGWSASDVGDGDLVDDEHIAADPTSWVVSDGA